MKRSTHFTGWFTRVHLKIVAALGVLAAFAGTANADLISRYTFSNSGDLGADAVGGINLTANGTVTQISQSCNGVSLNGVTLADAAYLAGSNNKIITSGQAGTTISFWANLSPGHGGYSMVFGCPANARVFQVNGGRFSQMNDSNPNGSGQADWDNANMTTGWHLYTFTETFAANGNSHPEQLYLDGTLLTATDNGVTGNPVIGAAFNIGNGQGTAYCGAFSIADVQIYDTVLSADDIQYLYENHGLTTEYANPILSVTLDSPTDAQEFSTSDDISAAATVSFGTSPYSVTFYTNGVSAWSTNDSTDTSFTFDLGTLPVGSYEIYATVTDAASSNAVSATNTFTVAVPPPVVTYVGTDTTATAGWRTASVAKPNDIDGDNIYGTDGYTFYQYGNSGWFGTYDAYYTHEVLPSYISSVSSPASGWGGSGNNFGVMDDPLNPTSDRPATWGYAAASQQTFTITRSSSKAFRLTLWASTAAGGAGKKQDFSVDDGSGAVSQTLTFTEVTKVYYMSFDIPAGAGAVTVNCFNNTVDGHPGLGGFAFDSIPTLGVTVTSPANGQELSTSDSISPMATVADGTPPYSVTFYTNGASAWSTNDSMDTSYTFDLGTLPIGSYEIYATVSDNVGSNAVSATNTFTVAEPPPIPLAGLALWLDASQGVTEGSGSVQSWADQSPNGRTATLAGGGGAPALVAGLVNGLPAIQLRGNDDYLSVSGGSFVAKYAIYVFRNDPSLTTFSNYGAVFGSTGGGDRPEIFQNAATYFHPSPSLPVAVSKNGSELTAGSSFDMGVITNWMVLAVQLAYPDNSRSYYIGRQDGYGCDLDIAEVIVYDHVLTPADEIAAGAYLGQKYGIETEYAGDLRVTLTSPTDAQEFSTSDDISAAATVSFGTPPYSVTFYTNGTMVAAATVTNSPTEYQVSLGTLPIGTYEIYAEVSDAASSNAVSATNTFTVAALPPAPVFAVAAPTGISQIDNAGDLVVAISGMANTTPIAENGVTFQAMMYGAPATYAGVGGTAIVNDTNGGQGWNGGTAWPGATPNGSGDTLGIYASWAWATIQFTGLAPNTDYKFQSFHTFDGWGGQNRADVKLTIGAGAETTLGNTGDAPNANALGKALVTVTFNTGSSTSALFTYTATAGNRPVLAAFQLRALPDASIPLVSIDSPIHNSVLSTYAPITAAATVVNGTPPYTVKFYTNSAAGPYGQAGGDVTEAPYEVSLGTLAVGTYHLYVTAEDSGATTGVSGTNVFTVVDLPPEVAITSPANDAFFVPGSPIVIQAAATDDSAVTNVDFYADTALLGSATSGPYSFTWNDAELGTYALTAVAWDDAGQATTSAVVNVRVSYVVIEWHAGAAGWGDITTSNLLQSALGSAAYTGYSPGTYQINLVLEVSPYGSPGQTPNGATAQYNLDVAAHPDGFDITSVSLFAEHGDGGWIWPGGDVTYQQVGDATWYTLAGMNEFPNPHGGTVYPAKAFYNTSGIPSSYMQSRTTAYPSNTLTGVSAIRIEFAQQLNGGAAINEIGVYGAPTPPALTIFMFR